MKQNNIDLDEQLSNNSEEQLLDSLILQYDSFRKSADYDEQYKWDYANKHKNEFDDLDDFEKKIAGLGNYNFRPYFLQRTGLNNLMQSYNIETFKASLKILLDESIDLEKRIKEFLDNLRNLLKSDEHWNNKNMMPNEVDASYFLFTNDYTKYLLFNPKTSFNNFAKKFQLKELLDKSDRIKRYIKIQNYCKDVLLPKMNKLLGKNHTLLDAQDFIRYVDSKTSVDALRSELLEYYKNIGFIIDDTPKDYTAIKSKYNIAEVHKVNSKHTKFKVVINYDKLPEDLRNDCKRVPDDYGWTLNGECWVNSRDSLDDVIRKIDSTLDYLTENNYKKHKEIKNMNIPLNQILYGPPGTGKTYNTVLKAMSIIDNTEYRDVPDEKYSELKRRFNELKQVGQIEFVTFHQSYSYEDFVEGIKPDLRSEDLKYILKIGSFKRICDSAKDIQRERQAYNFNYNNLSLYKILMPYNELFEYCIENNCVAIGWGDDINLENCNSEKDLANIIPENNDHRLQCISQLNMFKLWIDKDLREGKDVIAIIPGSTNTIKGIAKITGNYKYNPEINNGQQQRKAEWIKTDINIPSDYIYSSKFVPPTITGMYKDKINEDNLMKLLNNTSEQKSKNAVLIIDEINRGNISKIFGELITLIEEDKRDNMEVTLPYSDVSFTVPKNLYIIGTMNTSDRSIASIDIALRRRFVFKEIMPDVNLIPNIKVFGIELRKIFTTLNERISILLDRDHQIGHSYFMKLDNSSDCDSKFKRVWYDCVMPLLNEYFYGDWEKLCALLGDPQSDGKAFIKKLNNVKFANNYSCDEDETYDFVSETNIDFKAAIENAFPQKTDKSKVENSGE